VRQPQAAIGMMMWMRISSIVTGRPSISLSRSTISLLQLAQDDIT